MINGYDSMNLVFDERLKLMAIQYHLNSMLIPIEFLASGVSDCMLPKRRLTYDGHGHYRQNAGPSELRKEPKSNYAQKRSQLEKVPVVDRNVASNSELLRDKEKNHQERKNDGDTCT